MDLKQSTASQEILLGPFLDDDDGVTQKTGLTIANTDIKIFKAGGTTLGNKNSGGATEIATGFYYATLDATDTDTLGLLVVVVQITDCLCVRHEFNVVSAAYYDWVYGSTKPSVDVDTIKTQAVTCAAGVTVLASVGTAATSTAQTGDSYAIVNGDHGLVSIQDDVDAIKAKTDLLTFEAVTNHIEAAVQNITNDAITAASINTGAFTADAFAADAIVAATLATGAITADAFAADAIVAATLATGALTSDAFAAGAITNAAVADDVDVNVKTMTAGVITATVIADNAIDLATFAADCKTGSALKANVETITAGAIAAASLNADMDTELATIIWNAATASYGGAGTYGQAVEDILADTNELQVDDTPTAIAAIATTLGVAGAGLTALPWNAAWDTEVQSECTDALNAYDPPTKAELDTAQGAVVVSAAGIDAIFDRNSTLSLSFETLINRTYQILNNAMTVNETTGVVALKAIGGASDIASGDVDSAAGVTDRDELTWS